MQHDNSQKNCAPNKDPDQIGAKDTWLRSAHSEDSGQHGPELIIKSLCSNHLSMKCVLLIKVKTPTICWHFNIYTQDKYSIWEKGKKKTLFFSVLVMNSLSIMLSWVKHEQMFYNL